MRDQGSAAPIELLDLSLERIWHADQVSAAVYVERQGRY
jgi:hypothetical protein